MKRTTLPAALTVLLSALLLTGCGGGSPAAAPSPAPSTQTATPSASASPSPSASPTPQALGNGSIDDATLDEAFLAGARKAIPDGPDDATLIAMGRGICTDLAAGAPAQASLDKVKTQGLSQTNALVLMVAAQTVYCSNKK